MVPRPKHRPIQLAENRIGGPPWMNVRRFGALNRCAALTLRETVESPSDLATP